jgi:hypothetical protein
MSDPIGGRIQLGTDTTGHPPAGPSDAGKRASGVRRPTVDGDWAGRYGKAGQARFVLNRPSPGFPWSA